MEIDGLILDETRSKLAHDFYELFYANWRSGEEVSGNFTIVIREQPAQIGIGTRIIVEVDGEQLSNLNLQPRLEVLESLAAQLAESLRNHFQNPDGEAKKLKWRNSRLSGVY